MPSKKKRSNEPKRGSFIDIDIAVTDTLDEDTSVTVTVAGRVPAGAEVFFERTSFLNLLINSTRDLLIKQLDFPEVNANITTST